MKDITTIDYNELQRDKEESLLDIITCESALKLGITNYSGGSVQERLDVNRMIVKKIDAEILRRTPVQDGNDNG